MKNSKTTTRTTKTAAATKTKTVAAVATAQTDAQTYTFISPKGKEFVTTNISAFARRFNLDRSALSRVARGERSIHKNWTAKTN